MKVLLALCTCPNAELAERIAHVLVEEGLAACVNRVPGVVSTYRWQGKICHDQEELLMIKTTDACFDRLKTRILELHSYELPEIIGVDVDCGLDGYLAWVAQQVQPR